MKDNKTKFVVRIANIGYIITSIILFLIAIWIVIASVFNVFSDIRSGTLTVYNILDEVALIVFAFAVIDVSKYLILEEVLRSEQDRRPAQARRALRKLVIIIFTALSLEGLITAIQYAKIDVTKMIYPGILIFVTTLYLVGLGIYQYLNSKSER